jgi:response regulator RpfG family c-di-GMP phosphodiesterase
MAAASVLSAVLKSHHGATGEHTERTRLLAGRLAPEFGLRPEVAWATRYAAFLHDVGKIYVPSTSWISPVA